VYNDSGIIKTSRSFPERRISQNHRVWPMSFYPSTHWSFQSEPINFDSSYSDQWAESIIIDIKIPEVILFSLEATAACINGNTENADNWSALLPVTSYNNTFHSFIYQQTYKHNYKPPQFFIHGNNNNSRLGCPLASFCIQITNVLPVLWPKWSPLIMMQNIVKQELRIYSSLLLWSILSLLHELWTL